VKIQREMIDREPELPEERSIKFRMGINLGDVIAEEDDIYGDGVNVAARLEALAELGASVSRALRNSISVDVHSYGGKAEIISGDAEQRSRRRDARGIAGGRLSGRRSGLARTRPQC
jgi:class 3 adenylate cyclase